ncbi:MAG TPA: hypothetical protein VKB76_20760 [Ktedonobacterales bacterium]|nr:hypothetical protein [Ktedonobacterales bacterium]
MNTIYFREGHVAEQEMPELEGDALADDEEDAAIYDQLEELEKLETIIALMEELGIDTLTEAKERFDALERSIDADA